MWSCCCLRIFLFRLSIERHALSQLKLFASFWLADDDDYTLQLLV